MLILKWLMGNFILTVMIIEKGFFRVGPVFDWWFWLKLNDILWVTLHVVAGVIEIAYEAGRYFFDVFSIGLGDDT